MAEARKHARMVTASTMQADTTTTTLVATTITAATVGTNDRDGTREMTAVSVVTSDNHNHNNSNNSNSDASSPLLALNTHEQGLVSTRTGENELRVAQLERQLHLSEQQTKALEQGLETQGSNIWNSRSYLLVCLAHPVLPDNKPYPLYFLTNTSCNTPSTVAHPWDTHPHIPCDTPNLDTPFTMTNPTLSSILPLT